MLKWYTVYKATLLLPTDLYDIMESILPHCHAHCTLSLEKKKRKKETNLNPNTERKLSFLKTY